MRQNHLRSPPPPNDPDFGPPRPAPPIDPTGVDMRVGPPPRARLGSGRIAPVLSVARNETCSSCDPGMRGKNDRQESDEEMHSSITMIVRAKLRFEAMESL